MNIEAKQYVADAAYIRKIATDTLSAKSALDESRSTYLKVLVGTTQARCREGKVPKSEQLRMARSVHREFLEIVVKTVMQGVKAEDRVEARQSRTNFARTASSTLNSWLRAEKNDLMDLKPSEVTKGSLRRTAAPRKPHSISSDKAEARADAYVAKLLAGIAPYAAQDAAEARKIIERAANLLSLQARQLAQDNGIEATWLNGTWIKAKTKRDSRKRPMLVKKAA